MGRFALLGFGAFLCLNVASAGNAYLTYGPWNQGDSAFLTVNGWRYSLSLDPDGNIYYVSNGRRYEAPDWAVKAIYERRQSQRNADPKGFERNTPERVKFLENSKYKEKFAAAPKTTVTTTVQAQAVTPAAKPLEKVSKPASPQIPDLVAQYRNLKFNDAMLHKIADASYSEGITYKTYEQVKADPEIAKRIYLKWMVGRHLYDKGYTFYEGVEPAVIWKAGDKHYTMDVNGKEYELFRDADGKPHVGSPDGPTFPVLDKKYDESVLEYERQEKKASDGRKAVQKELASYSARKMKLKSTFVFKVKQDQSGVTLLGHQRFDYGKHPEGQLTDRCVTGEMGGGYNNCCLEFTNNPDYGKQWQIEGFDGGVKIASELRSEGSSRVLIQPNQDEKWKIVCEMDNSESLEKLLGRVGITLAKSGPASFFNPMEEGGEESGHPFSLKPRVGKAEHLPEGTEFRLKKDFVLPPGLYNGEHTYRLAEGGPMQCRILTDASASSRELPAGTAIHLGKSSTRKDGGNRIWRWEVSGNPGIKAFECFQDAFNYYNGAVEGEGMSSRDLATAMSQIADVVPPGESAIPIHEFGPNGTCSTGSCKKEFWTEAKLFNQGTPLDIFDLNRFPDGAVLKMKAGSHLIVPPDAKELTLTKPDAPVSCKLTLGTANDKKLKDLDQLKLVSVQGLKSYDDNKLLVDAGDGQVLEMKCEYTEKKRRHQNVLIGDLKKSLLDEIELTMPKAIPMGSLADLPKGELKVSSRYKDCAGTATGEFRFVFNDTVTIAAGERSLDLGNGCKMEFAPSNEDRDIGKDDAITVGGFEYTRTVAEVDAKDNVGLYTAASKRVTPSMISKVTCDFPSSFPADTEKSCRAELLETFDKRAKGSLIRFEDKTSTLGSQGEITDSAPRATSH